jgi:carbon monoxide dehydrogenase subunit G
VRLGLAAPLAALLLAPAPAHADAAVQVDVVKRGGAFMVDTVMAVPVPLPVAWAVMNDFDAMARFVPNLTESRIVARHGNHWIVEQKGAARFGPFRIAFESLRALELTPDERVVARQIKGSMRSAQSETTFAPEGDATRIRYHAQMEPAFWVPGFISRPIIEQRVRAQFDALAAEMMRRQAQAAADAAPQGGR